jgi:hypothetical protein
LGAAGCGSHLRIPVGSRRLWLPSQNTSWEPQVVAPISECQFLSYRLWLHLRMPVGSRRLWLPSQNASRELKIITQNAGWEP